MLTNQCSLADDQCDLLTDGGLSNRSDHLSHLADFPTCCLKRQAQSGSRACLFPVHAQQPVSVYC